MISDETAEAMAATVRLEKRLCGALMRQWSPDISKQSVASLVVDVCNEVEKLRRERNNLLSHIGGIANQTAAMAEAYGLTPWSTVK